jgi:hypothetical protein
MTTREDLKPWIVNALTALGGKARIAKIGQHIWKNYEAELARSGEFFYKWQYEMRWAGDQLVREGRIRKAGAWELV